MLCLKIAVCLGALLLSATPVWPQVHGLPAETASELLKTKEGPMVDEIRFTGLRRIAPAAVAAQITCHPGDRFDPSTIEITAGEPVRLVIRSKDVTHGFSVPKLNIDVLIPKNGEPVAVEFIAPPPGRFEIACSEFCGSGHGQMKAALISVAATPTTR